ncbi:MAG: MerR family transcriptional regulator [Streptomycetaceae bacterium]|nr:MerR family transcriptional regulator [Nocardioidaceae bacterium]NUS58636.1 MerR family transcriptional regulator [Streptomycetaceae bacterium]
MTVLPFDLHHDLITVAQAAELAGVTDDVIRQWKRRGHLEPAGTDDDGRPMFTGIAVLRAEAKTRKGARRYPTPAPTERDHLTNSA